MGVLVNYSNNNINTGDNMATIKIYGDKFMEAMKERFRNFIVSIFQALDFDIIPKSGVSVKIGTPESKISEIHTDTISVGDIKLSNGWKIVEDNEYGLILVSPRGKRYRILLEEIK